MALKKSRRGPGRPRKPGRPKGSRSRKAKRVVKKSPKKSMRRTRRRVAKPKSVRKYTYKKASVRSRRKNPEMTCRSRTKQACGYNPNCAWQKKSGKRGGCKYRSRVKQGVRYFGPEFNPGF